MCGRDLLIKLLFGSHGGESEGDSGGKRKRNKQAKEEE